MGKHYNQLSLEERYRICHLQREGYTLQKIAAIMARSASTVSREIKRNQTSTLGYDAGYAEQQTLGRRWRGSKLERQPKLRTQVLDLLAMGWSPEQTAKRLTREQGCRVISYESIYRFIYSQIKRTKDYNWRHYLPSGKTKRRPVFKKRHSSVVNIKDRVSIHQRDKNVISRQQAGHWEADLMLFSKYGQAILVAHERHSRLTLLYPLENKEAKPIAAQLISLMTALPSSLAQTITFDNGTEFALHHLLNQHRIKTFFCDAYAPWQKGGVENAIGRIRRFLPRKTDLNLISPQKLLQITIAYNLTPRKCLGYKTPLEVFKSSLLHFKCESTCPPAWARHRFPWVGKGL
jgi:IS30 family transposase